MKEIRDADVPGAFEMLLEEIEGHISVVNRRAGQDLEKRDYEKAQTAIKVAQRLTSVHEKVHGLKDEWDGIIAQAQDQHESKGTGQEKRNLGRLRRGLRTPEKAYYGTILKVVDELGGSAKMSVVLPRVGQLMKSKLRDVDYEPLSSDPEAIRWRNTAQWARNMLVNKGLLKSNSPHGIWEITEAGRKAKDKL
jgi:restriction system protein